VLTLSDSLFLLDVLIVKAFLPFFNNLGLKEFDIVRIQSEHIKAFDFNQLFLLEITKISIL